MKERLDVLLVKQGFFESREKAKAVIMSGIVYVNGQKSDKAGTGIPQDAKIEIRGNTCPYVSRGGLKLKKALTYFNIEIKDAIAMDMGASTGGFTDCMLQEGAQKVYSIDVGYGQLDWKLRNDPRVVNMEKINIRYLEKNQINDMIDFITIDVSFISLELILPVAKEFIRENGNITCLVKPQFEAGRSQIGKNGIVKDPRVHKEVIEKIARFSNELNLSVQGLTFSPMTGAKGNIEYLLYLKNPPEKESAKELSTEEIDLVVLKAHELLG